MARQKSSHVTKHQASKHKEAKQRAARRRSSSGKRHRSVAEQKPLEIIERTPVDKHDCIAVSQAIYGQARTMSHRTRQSIPKEFERVVSNLDEFCGEEEFDKARITIDWMNTCLQNFTKDSELGFCSRSQSYYCAIGAQSADCRNR
jgi:hypothetical protein